MKLPLFITGKLQKESKGTFSKSTQRLTLIIITVSVASLTVSLFIFKGFEAKISEKIYNFNGHLTISKFSPERSFENSSILISNDLIKLLKASPDVDHWREVTFKTAMISSGKVVQGVVFKGINSRSTVGGLEGLLKEGTFPDLPSTGYGLEVMMSRSLARLLDLQIGNRFILNFVQSPPRTRKMNLVGLFETGFKDFDEKVIIGDSRLVSRLNGWDQNRANCLEIILTRDDRIASTLDHLSDRLDIETSVESVQQRYGQLFDWLYLLRGNIRILITLIVTVVSFLMVSIILILILDRSRMVGILKAMGIRDATIRMIFIIQGSALLLRGILLGNILGCFLSFLQYRFEFIKLDQENYFVSHVPIYFDWYSLLLVNLLFVFLVSLCIHLPARRIGSIDPIRVIRFD